MHAVVIPFELCWFPDGRAAREGELMRLSAAASRLFRWSGLLVLLGREGVGSPYGLLALSVVCWLYDAGKRG